MNIRLIEYFSKLEDVCTRFVQILFFLCGLLSASITFAADELLILTEEFPPLNFTQDGKPTGMAVEIVEAIMQRLNTHYPIKVQTWSDAYQTALIRPNTVLFSTARTPQREHLFKWVGPLIKNSLGFYVREDSPIQINSLDDAKQVGRIGTVRHYASEQFLIKRGFTHLFSANDPTTCARNLIDGWIDLWVMPDIVMPYVTAKAGISPRHLKQIFSIEEPTNYIAFSKGTDDQIIGHWQQALNAIKEDGTYSRIVDRWLSDDLFAHSRSLTTDERNKAKQITLDLITEEWPPINFTKNGQLTGFTIELISEIMARHQQHYSIRALPWHLGFQAAQQKPNTGLIATARTPSRENQFKWVGPLFTQTWGFIARKDAKIRLEKLEDAKKIAKIGVYQSDFGMEFLQENEFTNLVISEQNADNLALLNQGQIDLWISPHITLVHEAIAAGYDPAEFESVLNITEVDLYIAFSKQTLDEVILWWQNTLDEIKQDGTYHQLLVKWLPSLIHKQTLIPIRLVNRTQDSAPSTQNEPTSKSQTQSISTIELTPEQQQWLEKHSIIHLAPDPNNPPLEYFDDHDQYRGIAADFVALIEQKLGIRFTIVQLDHWNDVLKQAKEQQVDLLGAISHTPDRAKYLNFTRPYLDLPACIIVRQDDQHQQLDFAALAGLKVSVVEGYAIQEFLEAKYPEINLDLVSTPAVGLKKVSTGLVNAVILDMVDASYAINKEGIMNLRVAGETGYVYHLAFAVRKDWPELIDILDKVQASITPDEKQVILRRWIALGDESFIDTRLMWIILIVFSGLLLIVASIFIWNRALRQQVDNRTRDLQHELAERKKAERAISQYRDHLEELVKARTIELLESEKKFKTLFESANAAIFLLKDDVFIDCNDTTLEMFGCHDKSEVIGQNPSIFSPPKQPNGQPSNILVRQLLAQTLAGESPSFEWRHRRLDGTDFEAQINLNRVELGGEYCIQAIVQDISEQKKFQQELEIAKNKAEVGAKAKSDFLANMSHEIRTPLNAILGFSQLMKHDASLTDEQMSHLEIINRSGEHLLCLINQILEMSKIEAGRSTLNEETFDLMQLLSDLELMFKIRAEKKKLQLVFIRETAIPQFVKIDGGKLRQILVNLIGNAIKFTEQGQITIKLALITNDQQNLLHFDVTDTGPGIAEHEISQLFSAFDQTTAGIKAGGGTGLGLAISCQFVRLMGGDISVDSQPNQGSTFSFAVRVGLVKTAAFKSDQTHGRIISLASDEPTYRILVMEDEEDSRLLMDKLLSEVGFAVKTASNGRDGLEIWKTWQPHLVWMDMRMPIMDGYETTRRIKADQNHWKTVIIALTASAFEEERTRILDSGCDDFMRKPFRESELFEKIHQHLGCQFIDEKTQVASSVHHEPTAKTEIDRKQLAVLSPQLIAELRRATSSADYNHLLALFEQVQQIDTTLANHFRQLVDRFDYESLLSYFENDVISDG